MTSVLFSLLLAVGPSSASEPLDLGGAERQADRPDEGMDRFEDDSEAVDSQVVNGEETQSFPQVAQLSMQFASQENGFCSATLVSPNELITAAHCVDSMVQQMQRGGVPYAVFGGNVNAGEIAFASEIIDYANADRWNTNVRNGGDIAWLRIADDYTAIAPMPIYGGAVSDLGVGEVFDFVGFGVTGDNRGDSGIKRTAAIAFNRVEGDYLISRDSTKNVCSGDSGGAALRRVGEQHVLVGVNSFVRDTAGDGTTCFTGENGTTRIDLYRDWIQANTDASTELPDPGDVVDPGAGTESPFGDWDLPQRPPEDAVGTCSSVGPGTAGSLVLLLGLLGLRRRRS